MNPRLDDVALDQPSSIPAPLYLTADDVATLLQIDRATVYRLAKRDPTMPVLVLGGIVRFPKERLLTWLRAREQGRASRRPTLDATQRTKEEQR